MAISEYRERIIIQKSSLVKDKNGNQILGWADFYSCASYVNNLLGREYWAAAQVNAEKDLYFIIRYGSEIKDLDTEHYRIIFKEQIYNITFIDNIQYKNKTVKIRACLVKR